MGLVGQQESSMPSKLPKIGKPNLTTLCLILPITPNFIPPKALPNHTLKLCPNATPSHLYVIRKDIHYAKHLTQYPTHPPICSRSYIR